MHLRGMRLRPPGPQMCVGLVAIPILLRGYLLLLDPDASVPKVVLGALYAIGGQTLAGGPHRGVAAVGLILLLLISFLATVWSTGSLADLTEPLTLVGGLALAAHTAHREDLKDERQRMVFVKALGADKGPHKTRPVNPTEAVTPGPPPPPRAPTRPPTAASPRSPPPPFSPDVASSSASLSPPTDDVDRVHLRVKHHQVAALHRLLRDAEADLAQQREEANRERERAQTFQRQNTGLLRLLARCAEDLVTDEDPVATVMTFGPIGSSPSPDRRSAPSPDRRSAPSSPAPAKAQSSFEEDVSDAPRLCHRCQGHLLPGEDPPDVGT